MNAKTKDEGAVLLTTLLVMSLMAAVAVAVMEDVGFAVKRAINVQSYAQADWYMLGAEDFAESYIAQQVQTLGPEELNIGLKTAQAMILPIEGGSIALSIRDGSHCLSLGALGTSASNRTFRQLLTVLGWSQADAARLISVAMDWQDKDSQILPGGAEDYTYLGRTPARRTSNTAFTSVTELRSLDILSEDEYQSLRPFVCARGAAHPLSVNINTLSEQQAPLLAAVLGGEDAAAVATQLIAERPPEGYQDEKTLRAAPALTDFSLKNAQLDQLHFTPKYIWIEAVISFQQAHKLAAFEFAIEEGAAQRLYRGFGEEILRPALESPEL